MMGKYGSEISNDKGLLVEVKMFDHVMVYTNSWVEFTCSFELKPSFTTAIISRQV